MTLWVPEAEVRYIPLKAVCATIHHVLTPAAAMYIINLYFRLVCTIYFPVEQYPSYPPMPNHILFNEPAHLLCCDVFNQPATNTSVDVSTFQIVNTSWMYSISQLINTS